MTSYLIDALAQILIALGEPPETAPSAAQSALDAIEQQPTGTQGHHAAHNAQLLVTLRRNPECIKAIFGGASPRAQQCAVAARLVYAGATWNELLDVLPTKGATHERP